MSKNIILCADGTWNGPGEPDGDDKAAHPTNVLKLFRNLDGHDTLDTYRFANEQERALILPSGVETQIAKYFHGVGDSDNPLVKLLGGTLGAGLTTRIVRGYTFISRNYVRGDKIFIVGFSRGAYTARAVAGLITAKGLLDPANPELTDKESAYRLGSAVWYDYRRTTLENNPDNFNWQEALEIAFRDLPAFFRKDPRAIPLLSPVQIEAVGVWDTVGALGIPEFDSGMVRTDVFRFADTKLSPIVRHGLHAIAVDEQREDFVPTLWDPDPRITQVLFPGAHSDVGGGYPSSTGESGLSDCALRWMMTELQKLDVKFANPYLIVPQPDAAATAHQPWTKPPFNLLPKGLRKFQPGLGLSHSILDRMKQRVANPDPAGLARPYYPENLGAYLAGQGAAPEVIVVAC